MEDNSKKDLLRYQLTGRPSAQWEKLQEQIFDVIEELSIKVSGGSGVGAEVAKDITAIALDWVQAKVEKPSLENEKLRSEIALNFASYKKTLSESEKINEEKIGIQIDNLTKLVNALAILKSVSVSFAQVNGDAHLFIGVPANELTKLGQSDKVPENNTENPSS